MLIERWCWENNLVLNVNKMKEVIINFLRTQTQQAPLASAAGCPVERAKNVKFLDVQLWQDLSWTKNTTGTKRYLQRLPLLSSILQSFYRSVAYSQF